MIYWRYCFKWEIFLLDQCFNFFIIGKWQLWDNIILAFCKRFHWGVKAKDRCVVFLNIFYDFLNSVELYFLKLKSFNPSILWADTFLINKLIDNDIHFSPVEVISQLPHIPNLANHISKCLKVYLLNIKFLLLLLQINITLVILEV